MFCLVRDPGIFSCSSLLFWASKSFRTARCPRGLFKKKLGALKKHMIGVRFLVWAWSKPNLGNSSFRMSWQVLATAPNINSPKITLYRPFETALTTNLDYNLQFPRIHLHTGAYFFPRFNSESLALLQTILFQKLFWIQFSFTTCPCFAP